MKFRALLPCLVLAAAIPSYTQSETPAPTGDNLRIVEAVEYEGFDRVDADSDHDPPKPIYQSDMLLALSEQGAAIRSGDTLRKDSVQKASNIIEQWLGLNGYPKGVVKVDFIDQPNERVKLRFSVDRGPIVKVSEIHFRGNRNISTDEFLGNFRTCIKDDLDSYNSRKYEYCAQKHSRSLMYGRGYFRGKINGVTANLVGDSYEVSIAVEEGPRYRWGKIEIKGSQAFSENEILHMFGQSSGDIADGRALQNFVYDTLKNSYGEKGYVQFNAEFEPDLIDPPTSGDDGIVNVLITIDEGKVFTIRKIVFTSVDPSEQKHLIDRFPLRPGDIYIQSKAERGIEEINRLERYQHIDKDQNVEIRTDEEGGDIDLIIDLKKLDP